MAAAKGFALYRRCRVVIGDRHWIGYDGAKQAA
jgi:hypothetical protein